MGKEVKFSRVLEDEYVILRMEKDGQEHSEAEVRRQEGTWQVLGSTANLLQLKYVVRGETRS